VSGYLTAYAHGSRPAARRRAGREVVQAGVLRGADAVLHPGVRAAACIEVGKLPGVSVRSRRRCSASRHALRTRPAGRRHAGPRGARSLWSRSGSRTVRAAATRRATPTPFPVSSYHDLGTRRCSVHRGSTSPSDRQEPSASTFTRGSEILSSIPTLTRRPAHEEPGINRRSSLRVSPTHTHPRWSRPAAVAEQNLIPIGSWASHSCGHTAQARSVGSAVLGSARRDFSSVIGMFLTFRL
jgi:hypothetical protein